MIKDNEKFPEKLYVLDEQQGERYTVAYKEKDTIPSLNSGRALAVYELIEVKKTKIVTEIV